MHVQLVLIELDVVAEVKDLAMEVAQIELVENTIQAEAVLDKTIALLLAAIIRRITNTTRVAVELLKQAAA